MITGRITGGFGDTYCTCTLWLPTEVAAHCLLTSSVYNLRVATGPGCVSKKGSELSLRFPGISQLGKVASSSLWSRLDRVRV